jgi:alpha-tubulin suppressor-like RCC1 family protein
MTLVLPKSLVAGYSPFRVPTVPVEIDWSHPLSVGLNCLYVLGSKHGRSDMCNTGPFLYFQNGGSVPVTSDYSSSSYALKSAPRGLGGYQLTGGNAIGLGNYANSRIKLTNNFSLFWFGQPVGNSSGGASLNFGLTYAYNTSPYVSAAIFQGGGGTVPSFQFGTTGSVSVSGSSVAAGSTNVYCATVSSSLTGTLYQNGVSVGSATATALTYPASTGVFIGCIEGGSTLNAITYSAGQYSRVLSSSEVQWLTVEPFAMLKPIKSRVFYFPTQPSSRSSLVVPGVINSSYSNQSSGYIFPILTAAGTPSSTYVDMATMYAHKDLFLTSSLWACGYNLEGQLGNGTSVNVSSPVQTGGVYTWKQVSAFYHHTAMVRDDGSLWACGYNELGQLGNGTTTAAFAGYSSPIQVGGLTNWKQVSAGQYFTSAIKTDGTLWSWGRDDQGQLGNGVTLTGYSSPIQIGLLSNWKQVSAGTVFTAAIKTDGSLWTWGQNSGGTIGNGSSASYSSPIQIGSLVNWAFVSSGNSTAAIKTNGTLWTWGQNVYGQLGNGTTLSYSSPIQVGNSINWKQVSVNQYHTTAIKTDGTLWAWGNNSNGQLGNNTTISYSSPIQVGSMSNWKQVSSGWYHTTAVKTDGTLWACGYNNFGQLGNTTTVAYSSPIQVGSLSIWKQVSSGGYHTAIISAPDFI